MALGSWHMVKWCSYFSAISVQKALFYLFEAVLNDFQFLDVRVAVVGPADAGKSTLLGVLTRGELDNGRGKARLNLFRHLHEIQSGRTSSISKEILGFNADGQVRHISRKPTYYVEMQFPPKIPG